MDLSKDLLPQISAVLSSPNGSTPAIAPEEITDEAESKLKHPREMTPDEIRARIIELGFGGDAARLENFCDLLRSQLPPGTGVAIRGSTVTGERWEDGSPFDAKGKGTSDIDVTLIGDQVMACWGQDGFYIPALHTKPAGDEYPEMAPSLEPLRRELQALAQRPVNFQATNNLILYVRDILMGQPYFMLIDPEASSDAQSSEL